MNEKVTKLVLFYLGFVVVFVLIGIVVSIASGPMYTPGADGQPAPAVKAE